MKKGKEKRSVSSVMKWVGYITAVLSLCATIVGVAYDREVTNENMAAFLAVGAEQQKARDYSSAWQSLENAQQLGGDSRKVQEAQERLAMAWLDDVHLQQKQTFSEVANKLEPVLTRAAAETTPGQHQADLRAHIGWAYFLESREGRADLNPAGPYGEAVAEDPNNPYARAMWGYWILWQNCSRLQDASGHFAAALASQRQGDSVRRLQMAALPNCHDDDSELEVILTANAMRKEQRPPGDWERSRFPSIYYGWFFPQTSRTVEFINAVRPSSIWPHFAGSFLRRIRTTPPNDAAADYNLVLTHFPPRSTPWQQAGAALNRLSHR